MSYSPVGDIGFGADNWCLKFQPLNSGLLTTVSDGSVHLLDWNEPTKVIQKYKVSDVSINSVCGIIQPYDNENSGVVFAVASGNQVKIYDARCNGETAVMKHEGGANVLSLGAGPGQLAYGTELQGADAELHLYDIRSYKSPLRSFVDSHHDDITDIKFHPTNRDLLMSGSTDGYTNIYDLTEEEEDDALHQVINYASIHSCGWLSPNRIYTLSHMETFSIHELNDKSDELVEPQPVDFGDIREPWGCDYVVDVYPGKQPYIATGRTQEKTGELKIIPMVDEKPVLEYAMTIPQAHGDEVVRDTYVREQRTLYSCGEDGYVRIWQRPDIPALDSTDTQAPVEMQDQIPEEEVQKSKSKKHSTKKKKHSKKPRFKPY